MSICVDPGLEFFAEFRQENVYYVDKTGFLEEFLTPKPLKQSLFTRPRRFGKTLMLTMMAEFFDITKKSAALFEGLTISRNEKLCREWMNQYPVIFLSLKDIRDKTYELAFRHIADLMADQISNHLCLLESPDVALNRRLDLNALLRKQADVITVQRSLYTLCRSLLDYYGKPAVLLVDEYDVPVYTARQMGFYDEMISFIHLFLSPAVKSNAYIKFAVLTGCLRITKESIFTGLNNLNCFDISEEQYADAFGFTENEVRTMLEAFGMADKMEEVREWYDGYHFGNREDIYCPWGITKYVAAHLTTPDKKPEAYWLNTSGNDIARNVLATTHIDLTEKIEQLIDGGCIRFVLHAQMNYADIDTSVDYFWSLMYLTGYLTRASVEQQKRCGQYLKEGDILCCIPNKEVAEVWQKQVQQWFASLLLEQDENSFTTALWQGDCAGLENVLAGILLNRLSFHDLREYAYHVLLAALFPAGCSVTCDHESGLGRYDIVARDEGRNRAAVIEVKRADTEQQLEGKAREALQQIAAKKYDTDLRAEHRYTTILHYGMAFCGKLCKVMLQRLDLHLDLHQDLHQDLHLDLQM